MTSIVEIRRDALEQLRDSLVRMSSPDSLDTAGERVFDTERLKLVKHVEVLLVKLDHPTQRQAKVLERMERVRKLLDSSLTYQEIAEKLDLTWNAVQEAIQALRDQGDPLASRKPDRKYTPELIRDALRQHPTISAAARSMKMAPPSLHDLINRYGIRPEVEELVGRSTGDRLNEHKEPGSASGSSPGGASL